MNWMIKDSKGNKSATLTFAAIGMVISSIAVLASVMETFSVGDWSIAFREVDSTLILGFLAATVSAYVVRRGKGDQIEADTKNGVVR